MQTLPASTLTPARLPDLGDSVSLVKPSGSAAGSSPAATTTTTAASATTTSGGSATDSAPSTSESVVSPRGPLATAPAALPAPLPVTPTAPTAKPALLPRNAAYYPTLFARQELIEELLDYLSERGDVQTCAAVSTILGPVYAGHETQVRQWQFAYVGTFRLVTVSDGEVMSVRGCVRVGGGGERTAYSFVWREAE